MAPSTRTLSWLATALLHLPSRLQKASLLVWCCTKFTVCLPSADYSCCCSHASVVVVALTKYAVQTIGSNKKNLITGESSDKAAAEVPQGVKIIRSHWKGNVSISLIMDRTAYGRGAIPPQLEPFYKFDSNGNYYPILWCNEFWVLREQLMVLNDTVKDLKLDLSFEPLSLLKFSLYTQMDSSFSMQRDMFGAEEAESEEFKHMLIDNPPWLLALTLGISLLHMAFDMLAFKNGTIPVLFPHSSLLTLSFLSDIQFWKNNKSMEGLSVRTIYFNLVCEGIIFLYLLDNQTSWMVLFSAGMALVIEAWKITRAVNVTVTRTKSGLPWITLTDKSTYISSTKSFDQQAMQYLMYAIYPLVIGYSVYSFMYEEHKSIYSWLVGSLAGAVYTFGFIMMTPQLFINYKLKSVAHLPWRTFVYKALNTFIDDLFAFIIRMPTMHRLRVFRDDIIFVIYLYQRWIYPVDKKRIETQQGEGEAVPAEGSEPQQTQAPEEKKNN